MLPSCLVAKGLKGEIGVWAPDGVLMVVLGTDPLGRSSLVGDDVMELAGVVTGVLGSDGELRPVGASSEVAYEGEGVAHAGLAFGLEEKDH